MEIPGYEIKKVIGKGGMAQVYLALHKALNRNVAIKVMNRQQGDDTDFSERFLREARIVANLSHPNIVTIHDVGEHDGHNYLVMELLPSGETLSDKIKAGVDSQYALSIIRQVATALNVAHAKKIVHRDIKPDNIMFRADGSVVLMDFGVARSVDSAATQMTQAGMIIGTPQYMSPEQGEGEEIGAFSDIYSLGVVFYEMLTGEVPYTAETPIALVFKHISAPVPTLSGVLVAYQPLLERMMAKKREARYANCNHIIEDIDSISGGKPASHAASVKPVREEAVNTNKAATTIIKKSKPDKNMKLTKITRDFDVKKEKAKTGTSKKSRRSNKPFLWVVLGSMIAAVIYALVSTDIGKLKTLAGLDAGPVYSRVGSMISIPGGTFHMGNSSGDSSENPVHNVQLKAFNLGETEVTQKQWRLVMGNVSSYFKGCDNCPVENVSWDDVQVFLKKLNKQTGLHFRLPNEAEWEYACRSGGRQERYCGVDEEDELAWYGKNSDEKTHLVAQKQSNGLGLYDMSGNVWEWTQDCWNDSYDNAPLNGRAWESGDCTQRVLRGGSWIDLSDSLSSTGRFESSADEGFRNFGFRLAQDI